MKTINTFMKTFRELIQIVEGFDSPTGESKWWLHSKTGEVLNVPRAHGDVVADTPEKFGISDDTVQKIKTTYGDSGDESADGEWWEFLRYEAMKNGWIRLGAGHDGFSITPYVYAATMRQARVGVNWLVKKGVISDRVDIEITNPDDPHEGYGDFYKMLGGDIQRFLRGSPARDSSGFG